MNMKESSAFFKEALSSKMAVAGLIDLMSKHKDLKKNQKVKQFKMADRGTLFYHYNCEGEEDRSWGCAYRALQTIVSCYRTRGMTKDTPSIDSIQRILIKYGEMDKSKYGTHEWIEPPDAATYIRQHLKLKAREVNYGKMVMREGHEIEAFEKPKDEKIIVRDMMQHFEEYGTPIMIDDSIKAYTIVGIREIITENESGNETQTQCLRFDPHQFIPMKYEQYAYLYENGKMDRFVAWMDINDIFTSEGWMLCYPQF